MSLGFSSIFARLFSVVRVCASKNSHLEDAEGEDDIHRGMFCLVSKQGASTLTFRSLVVFVPNFADLAILFWRYAGEMTTGSHCVHIVLKIQSCSSCNSVQM
eukprot:2630029-Amphidinium_carterae.1